MASLSKLDQTNELLESMSASELKDVLNRVVALRKTLPCGFLELPAELRNTLYRMTITPQVLCNHVKYWASPALLRVNRQTSAEFSSLYFNPEFITVELYHGPAEGWKQHTELKLLQALVANWSGYHTSDILDSSARAKRVIEELYSQLKLDVSLRMGVLRWEGIPEGRVVGCHYCPEGLKPSKKRREAACALKVLRLHSRDQANSSVGIERRASI